jgi:hypothetical protein
MPDEKLDFRFTDGPISYCRVPEDKEIEDCLYFEKGYFACFWIRNGGDWCGRPPELNNSNEKKE